MIRDNKEIYGKAIKLIGIIMSLIHIYLLGFYPINPWILLHIHLSFGVVLCMLLYPAFSRSPHNRPSFWDIIAVILSIMSAAYFIIEANTIPYRIVVAPSKLDLIFSFIIVLLVLESSRRTLGLALPILSIFSMLYARYGYIIPGILGNRGYDWSTVISQCVSTSAIFGVSLSASAYYVFLLVLFSAFLYVIGAGDFLIDLASSIAGRQRGGPAKIAVFASALFGTISGNSVANVTATGTITIPLMKKIGYTPVFSGAVEAVSSTGGQIMPPIMGSAAFIMAELLGISYLKIIIAALVPAMLYFLSVFIMIDLQAGKRGLKGLKKELVPSLKHVLLRRGYFLIPLIVLIFSLVVLRTSVIRAALWAIVSVILVTAFNRKTPMGPSKIFEALFNGAKISIPIISACACAGLIVGVFLLTGLGFKITEIILRLSSGSTILALILSSFAALILGMGLPTTASYLICSAIVAPALIEIGFIPIAAHFFILYYACLSAITPPIALAAFAAAGLANANSMSVGFTAVKLAFAAYVVPFMFIYGPELLGQGRLSTIFIATVTAIIGIIVLSTGLQGWTWIGNKVISFPERALLIFAAFCSIKPGFTTDVLGMTLIASVFVIGWISKKTKLRILD